MQANRDRMQANRDRMQANRDRMQANRDRMQANRDRMQADHDTDIKDQIAILELELSRLRKSSNVKRSAIVARLKVLKAQVHEESEPDLSNVGDALVESITFEVGNAIGEKYVNIDGQMVRAESDLDVKRDGTFGWVHEDTRAVKDRHQNDEWMKMWREMTKQRSGGYSGYNGYNGS